MPGSRRLESCVLPQAGSAIEEVMIIHTYSLKQPAQTHRSPAIGAAGRSEYMMLFFSRRSDIASRVLRTMIDLPRAERCMIGPECDCDEQYHAVSRRVMTDRPYSFAQRAKVSHVCLFGICSALPKTGRPRGPGGVGVRLIHLYAWKARKHTATTSSIWVGGGSRTAYAAQGLR